MEIGNLLFGHSRGEYEIPRGVGYEEPLVAVLDATGEFDNSYNNSGSFENYVFAVHAYYWGDCTCGYDEKECKWSEDNDHEEHCYQKCVERALIENGWRRNEWGSLEAPSGSNWDACDPIRKQICDEMGLSFPSGSAVHCTCQHEELWQRFVSENCHAGDCPIVRPNFLHKPSGLEVRWYKYPLRDSYMNAPLNLYNWRAIMNGCLRSLSSGRRDDPSPLE